MEIIETNEKRKISPGESDEQKRITFAKYKDPLGYNAYKFVGIFQLRDVNKNDGTRYHEKISDKCQLIR